MRFLLSSGIFIAPRGPARVRSGVDEQLEFLKLIASRLDGAGTSYMLTGSIALAVCATPRMTRDVDVVVECSEGRCLRAAGV